MSAAELQQKHDHKMQALRDELELRRKTEIHEIEEVRHSVCITNPEKAVPCWMLKLFIVVFYSLNFGPPPFLPAHRSVIVSTDRRYNRGSLRVRVNISHTSVLCVHTTA